MTVNTTTERIAVSAEDVRVWARGRGFQVADHGRLSIQAVNAYNKAHKAQYQPTWAQPARVVKVAGRKADSKGINRKVIVKTTYTEVRTWARDNGFPELSDRGRIPANVMDAFANKDAAIKA